MNITDWTSANGNGGVGGMGDNSISISRGRSKVTSAHSGTFDTSTTSGGSTSYEESSFAETKEMDNLLTVEDIAGSADTTEKSSTTTTTTALVGTTAAATAATSTATSTATATTLSSAAAAAQERRDRVMSAGLRTIIGDMVRAIEVAVWDAAMER